MGRYVRSKLSLIPEHSHRHRSNFISRLIFAPFEAHTFGEGGWISSYRPVPLCHGRGHVAKATVGEIVLPCSPPLAVQYRFLAGCQRRDHRGVLAFTSSPWA
jgi:hypothetical protein